MKKLLSLLVVTMFVACTKANTKPSFTFKKAVGNGIAAKIGDIEITQKELNEGLESKLYEAEMKKFDIKFGKVQNLIIQKLMDADPNKKGLTNDQYRDKYITSSIKISNKQVAEFIKERKIPSQHVNDQLREKIVNYLKEGEMKKAVDSWLAKKTKSKNIEIFFEKPRRPVFNVQVGDSPYKGNKDAKVTIVEFSDFQCPYCSRATQVLKDIQKKYGSKVKIVFKQYPLPFHNQAKSAAVAALCANEQGMRKFWDMHDAMFADQSKLSKKDLKQTAKKIGLDQTKFDKCLDSNKYLAKVEAEIKEGSKVSVQSTPTFFVNGKQINGVQPNEVFFGLIDEELAK
ncbi:MAG: thioredoxin domain-containing protein [Bacteriovoracaceae bacterium]|jgi:protein-disulfide isomerase|nr:thioredoxin domain-containing protein [Bacteriovoracaceae bacterium]